MRCKEVASRATDYSEGAVGLLLGWRVRRHLVRCDGCRVYVEQLRATGRALALLARGEVDARQQAAALQAFRAWEPRAAPAPAEASDPRAVVLLTGVAAVLSALASRWHAPWGPLWFEAGVTAAAACALVKVALRRTRFAAAAAVLAACVLSVLAGSGPEPAIAQVRCSIHELVTAALPVFALLRWGGSVSRGQLLGVAGAGALAGDAALLVACPDATAFLHVIVFHVGGVVVTLALAAACAAPLLRFSRAAS
jgi:hypothetical protein